MRRCDFSNFIFIFQWIYLKFDQELDNNFAFVRPLSEFKEKLIIINI